MMGPGVDPHLLASVSLCMALNELLVHFPDKYEFSMNFWCALHHVDLNFQWLSKNWKLKLEWSLIPRTSQTIHPISLCTRAFIFSC